MVRFVENHVTKMIATTSRSSQQAAAMAPARVS
jgi:hypothetical protein